MTFPPCESHVTNLVRSKLPCWPYNFVREKEIQIEEQPQKNSYKNLKWRIPLKEAKRRIHGVQDSLKNDFLYRTRAATIWYC